ncbi:MAG: glycosyltransferase family 4 protein [Hyphomicrobiaceae bacterium]
MFVTIADVGRLSGPSVHVLNLAKHLSRCSSTVTLICPKPSGELHIDHGPDVTRISPRFSLSRRLPSVALLPVLAYLMLRALRPQSVYLRAGAGTWPLALLAKYVLRARLVVECNGWLSNDLKALGYPRLICGVAEWMQCKEALLADSIRVVAGGLVDLLVAKGIPSARLAVIGNGTDVTVFRPLDMMECRCAHKLPDNGRLLAVVGNLWPALDLPTVFEAMRELRDNGVSMELLVIGDGGSRGEFAKRAFEILGPQPPVRWLGSRAPKVVNELLNAADVVLAPFAFSNEVTGLAPLKIRDYAAAGRPCVATAISGITALGNEPWMFLASPKDAAGFADGIAKALASEPKSTQAMARAYAERHFDWMVIAREVGRLFGNSSVQRVNR